MKGRDERVSAFLEKAASVEFRSRTRGWVLRVTLMDMCILRLPFHRGKRIFCGI